MEHTDFDIELQEDQATEIAGVQLPLNFLAFGEIEPDDVKVYIKQDVYKALEKLAASDTTKELGSIILGNYSQELGKTHVIISDYIEAKYTDASASTLTFTHETWEYVYKEHEQFYPDKKIIGWQHTHPNYGVFLSNYDMFIQENFFNMPFQVAYVIDPIQNIRGFFQWKNGKVEKLKGYYIYDDIGKPIKIEQTKVKQPASKNESKTSKWLYVIVALLCVATALLTGTTLSLNAKYNQQMLQQEGIQKNLTEQSQIITNQADTITKLQEQLVNGILDASGKTTAADLINMLESHEITLPNQDEILTELKAFIAKEDETGTGVQFKVYTVVENDTLLSICESNNIDYYANKNILLALNGIEDTDQIYIGQNILLPVND